MTAPTPQPRSASPAADESDRRTIDPLHPSLLWRILRVPARLGASALFGLKVYGRQHVPQTGGVLLVANHQSYLDPVLLAVYLRRPMSYLAKSELFENRYFSWLIRSLNAFPVKQGTSDVGAVKEMIRRLREGHMLNLYPEGTRTGGGEIGPMLPGAALVVKKAGVPIVPVVIEGSYDAWPRGRKRFRPHPISIMYGPPLNVAGLDSRQLMQLIDHTLRSMFDTLREVHRKRLKQSGKIF